MSARQGIIAAGLALLLAACGPSQGASSGVATLPSTNYGSFAGTSAAASPTASGRAAQAVAYAQCMRANGVAGWPDPDDAGTFVKLTAQQLGVSDARLQAAEAACQPILASGGGAPRQGKLHAGLAQLVAFAQCMRAHGIADMPDPDSQGQFAVGPGTSIDIHTDQFQSAQNACATAAQPAPPSP